MPDPTPDLTPEQISEGLRLDAALVAASPGKGNLLTREAVVAFWALAFHAAEHYGPALRQLQRQADITRLARELVEALDDHSNNYLHTPAVFALRALRDELRRAGHA